jgi:hypothetical protein
MARKSEVTSTGRKIISGKLRVFLPDCFARQFMDVTLPKIWWEAILGLGRGRAIYRGLGWGFTGF